jgi:antitoxin component YwqK of YwqJK toxin-antitoxin module
MDSLPLELVGIIIQYCPPKNGLEYAIAYDVAYKVFKDPIFNKSYKSQFLEKISTVNKKCTIRKDTGKKHGKYLQYYQSGLLWKNAVYWNGEKHGKCIRYYKNGQIYEDATYQISQIHGKCLEYYENGQIYIDTTYKNGQRHGKYLRYYKNGQLQIDTTYQIICDISQIHGKYTSYYENGQIQMDTTYKNNQKHGKFLQYYKNGQLWIDTTYQIICDISQIHGKYLQYHKNGQTYIDTTYKNGQIHGKFFRSNIIKTVNYKKIKSIKKTIKKFINSNKKIYNNFPSM